MKEGTEKEGECYKRGKEMALTWIEEGGSLDADGPDTNNEAFYNGFIDTLAEARTKAAGGKKAKKPSRVRRKVSQQSIDWYFEQRMTDGIKEGRWFKSAPPEFQKTAKFRVLGVEMKVYRSIIGSTKKLPTLIAECDCGGEVQKFGLLLESANNVHSVDE